MSVRAADSTKRGAFAAVERYHSALTETMAGKEVLRPALSPVALADLLDPPTRRPARNTWSRAQ